VASSTAERLKIQIQNLKSIHAAASACACAAIGGAGNNPVVKLLEAKVRLPVVGPQDIFFKGFQGLVEPTRHPTKPPDADVQGQLLSHAAF
jgi:hypothetical protein